MFQKLEYGGALTADPVSGKYRWDFIVVDDEFGKKTLVAEDTGAISATGAPIAAIIPPFMELYESLGLSVPLNHILYLKRANTVSAKDGKSTINVNHPLWLKYKDEIKRLKEADAKAPVGYKLGDRLSVVFEDNPNSIDAFIVDHDQHGCPVLEYTDPKIGKQRCSVNIVDQDSGNEAREKEDIMNPFKVGDLVSKRNGTDRIDGVVKWNTCFGATKSGGNVCSHKQCRHSPKDYAWVEWRDGKLYSYHANELMSSDDKMIQMEQEKALAQKKDVEEKVDSASSPVKEGFLDRTKKEGAEAAYRIAGTQMTKGVRTGICAALAKKGQSSEKIAAINEFLEGEFGAALISYGLGLGIEKIPGIGEDKRVKKLASEFRVQGFEKVGNELIGTAMEHVLPAITTALAALPKEETASKKTRVVHKEETNHEEEHEQEENETSLAKAMRA